MIGALGISGCLLCKCCPEWSTKVYATKVDARALMKGVTDCDKGKHLQCLRFVMAAACHAGCDRPTLESLATPYADMYSKPKHWPGKTGNCQAI